MTIEYLVAVIMVGLVVGYITSILFHSNNFYTILNVVISLLGAVLAGLLVPDVMFIKPPIVEYFFKALAGSLTMLITMALLR